MNVYRNIGERTPAKLGEHRLSVAGSGCIACREQPCELTIAMREVFRLLRIDRWADDGRTNDTDQYVART